MSRSTLTVERLRALLAYDPQTGVFTWLQQRGPQIAGSKTQGSLTNTGYRMICVDAVRYMAHRLAFLYMTGSWPRQMLDHKDRNRSNNVWANLREATNIENGQNSEATYHRSGVGFRGVTFRPDRQCWQAHIRVNGHQRFLGSFLTAEQASAAYQLARVEHHPFFNRQTKGNL